MNFFEDIDFQPLEDRRVEAQEKVTGKGKYAAEYEVGPGLCYGVLVCSTIPSGKIKSIHTKEAAKAQGVIKVVTHKSKRTIPGFSSKKKIAASRAGLPVFHTNQIFFKGQPIAMVVAESFEEATYAASLVSAEYVRDRFEVDFDKARKSVLLTEAGKERGKEEDWEDAQVTVEGEFSIAAEIHNPMEMHATIAHWPTGDTLKLYDKNQGVNSVQRTIGGLFNIPNENIEVFSEFVGGGFGSGLRVWSNTIAATLAAKMVKRPVKLVLTRQQMFFLTGYRPASWQKIKLGSDKNGIFTGAVHQAQNGTSVYESFNEGITRITRLIYKIPNLKTEGSIVPLNLSSPTWMRGPGDCTGDFAVESIIDELSYKVNVDPVEMRLKNISLEKHPDSDKPWSTNFMDECIKRGAEMIGWDERKPEIKASQEGDWYAGYGMAVGAWNAGRGTASVGVVLKNDGTLTLKTAMTDIGTGTGTGMQNMAHEISGFPKNRIKVELGHSSLPAAGSQGGSTGLSSISGAVNAAMNELKLKLAHYAGDDFKEAKADELILSDKAISFNGKLVSFNDILTNNKLTFVEVEATSGPGEERNKYAFLSAAAHFVKLKVNVNTGKVKIEKYACVADGGKIVNKKAAANQISGAVVGGIGMALMEEMSVDSKVGGLIADDLAGYHFAVNADAPIIDIDFINKPDPNINPSGAKGLGEVGIIGSAAAISNAIYHAIGKRLRDLPITPDKIIA